MSAPAGTMAGKHRIPSATPRENQAVGSLALPAKPGLRRVVIDLTPVLPGGDNGGAKVMTLELIRRLAAMAGHCEFLLLTSETGHEELASLDAPNVRRICVNRPAGSFSGLR